MDTDFCNKVVTIPQYLGTCWFNVILMAVLYSQNSRKLLLHNNIYKNKSNKLYQIINEIITRKYISVEKALKYFHVMRPEKILSKIILDKFFLDNITQKGYVFNHFLPIFLSYLGKTSITLDSTYDNKIYNINLLKNISNIDSDLARNVLNKIEKNQKIEKNPDYIIVNKFSNKSLEIYFNITHNINPDKIDKLKYQQYKLDKLDNTITYNGVEYILDSCLLQNYNQFVTSHAIAGITCKNNRYVYNGWIRSTQDANITDKNLAQFKTKPCELMKFDWDVTKENMFCLNHQLCKLDNILQTTDNNLCFSFDKGNRTLIYVRKNEKYTSIDKDVSTNSKSNKDKRCPEGKIINPKTGKCIKMESYNKLYNKPIIKDKKVIIKDKGCPEGKILNPKTGRCIKMESYNKLYKLAGF